MWSHAKLIILPALALSLTQTPSLATAGTVQIAMSNGRVSVAATDATVSEILAEWARVGRMMIVNGEKIQGGRITLELTDVTEKEALSVLLRSVSGYLAIARGPESASVSSFDRIVILPATPPPSSTIARQAPPQPVFQPPSFAFASPPGVARIIGPNGEPVPDDQDGAPPFVPGRAPGAYSRGDEPSASPALPPPGSAKPVGTSAPGMIVPAPAPSQPQPQPQR